MCGKQEMFGESEYNIPTGTNSSLLNMVIDIHGIVSFPMKKWWLFPVRYPNKRLPGWVPSGNLT